MQVLLSNMYYTSSTECNKVRIDRYRANVGPSNSEQLLVKIVQWKDKPIMDVNSSKVYSAVLRFHINKSKRTGADYINHDIIYIGEYKGGQPVDCLYSFILTKVGSQPMEVNEKGYSKNPESDDLPF